VEEAAQVDRRGLYEPVTGVARTGRGSYQALSTDQGRTRCEVGRNRATSRPHRALQAGLPRERKTEWPPTLQKLLAKTGLSLRAYVRQQWRKDETYVNELVRLKTKTQQEESAPWE